MERFEALFRCYYMDIYRFLMKLSHYNDELSEDLTQETFYQAYLALPSFQGNCHIKTWLIQIAKNQFFMRLRKNKDMVVAMGEFDVDFISMEESLENNVIRRQLLDDAWKVIASMPDKMREVLLYRLNAALPYAQIAVLLSITESSAKVLFYRGKNLLRAKLKEEYGYDL